jgi:hypothetical protein
MDIPDGDGLDIEMNGPSIVPNKVNVFGVSNLSTKEIEGFVSNILSTVGMTTESKVEWIDDDTCNIVFAQDEHAAQLLALGAPVEGSVEGAVSFAVPVTNEGEEPQMLEMRRANEKDVKNPGRSWRDSKFYKKRLEDRGINPETLAPVSRVILKPREGASQKSNRPTKVALVPRHLANKARAAMYGDEAFSKKKERSKKQVLGSSMEVDEEEIRRREERGRRFAAHS